MSAPETSQVPFPTVSSSVPLAGNTTLNFIVSLCSKARHRSLYWFHRLLHSTIIIASTYAVIPVCQAIFRVLDKIPTLFTPTTTLSDRLFGCHPGLQMRQLRHRWLSNWSRVTQLVRSLELNPDSLAPKTALLSTVLFLIKWDLEAALKCSDTCNGIWKLRWKVLIPVKSLSQMYNKFECYSSIIIASDWGNPTLLPSLQWTNLAVCVCVCVCVCVSVLDIILISRISLLASPLVVSSNTDGTKFPSTLATLGSTVPRVWLSLPEWHNSALPKLFTMKDCFSLFLCLD